MTPQLKSGAYPAETEPRSTAMEKALAACTQLPLLGGDQPALRSYIAETARDTLQALVAGMLIRENETYVLGSVSSESSPDIATSSLVSHAKAFAIQAIQKKKLLNFSLTSMAEIATVYHGLAEPLITAQPATVLVVLRDKSFSADELASFELLGNIARMALENAELTDVVSAQQQHLNQLLAISTELGATSHLDSFLSKFVVRAAEFLQFERVFVALVEGAECRVRWGCIHGVASPLNVEISNAGTRRILENKEPYLTDDVNEFPPGEKKTSETQSHRVKQYLGVPLLTSDGRSLGILGLVGKNDGSKVDERDVAQAKALGAEIAVALDAAYNLHLSEQHRKRAENLMEMALELGSALRLPEFVKNFTARVAGMMQARSAVLALAQGSRLESVGFFGIKLDRSLHRKLSAALSQYADKHPDLKITGSGVHALGKEVTDSLGWENLTLVRLEGTEGDLIGILCLADISKELLPNDLNLLQALIGHASVALENSRLFTRITQSSRQWAEIFDSITDFIVVHDEQYRVLRVNRSLAEFIGVRPAELIGMGMRALISLSAADTVQPCPFCRNENGADEYVHPSLERTYLVSTSRIHGALNEGLQTVHVLKDITDRREAERRYRELFDNVQEGVFFASPEGRFIEVNDALVRMLGYQSREELLKLDPETQVYLSAEQRDRIVKLLDEQGTVQNFEVSLRRRDGTLIHALENAFVVRDGQGKTLQYRGVLLDITEVKNFQAQLQRERDFTSKILNNTQTMIMVADTAGLISYANRRCYEAGAFDPQALVGNRLEKIIPESQLRQFAEAFNSSLHGSQVDNLEILIMRGDGAEGRFSVNLSPMRDEAGDVNSVVVLMTDITDAAMIQAKLMHTEKMAAVGQLVSGVAHEVNNPLTAIMGFSDLLMENPDLPDNVRKDLKVILEESQRTREIVKNLLSFARQRPAQRQGLQINAVLNRTVALRAYDFANSGIEVIKNFDESLPYVVGDAHQLQQVFLNILNNAFDAVRSTGRPGLIEIETRHSSELVEISFRDNGEGIKFPDRIFDPFFTTKEVGKGTGLGLSICYGIVREHEGEIICGNNKEMPGAHFTVRLPTKPKAKQSLLMTAGRERT